MVVWKGALGFLIGQTRLGWCRFEMKDKLVQFSSDLIGWMKLLLREKGALGVLGDLTL